MEEMLKRLDEASREGDINKLNELLAEDPLLLDRVLTMVRDNPLHIAALRGHAEFTSEVLLLRPELASQLNREGQTPLHLAAARGHLQVAQILVDKVDKEIHVTPNTKGIHISCGTAKLEMVKVPLCRITTRKSRLTATVLERKEGLMAVHIAIVNGKHDVAKMLIERYRELLVKTTERKETLLHLAIRTNNLDFIRYLVDKGVNLNEKDADENTCLHLAVANRNSQVITYLLDQESVEINSTNAMGLTPLDVLLVSSLGSAVDTSLVNMIRIAGGVGNKELNDLESNTNNSLMFNTPNSQRLPKWPKNGATEDMQSEAQTLLVVATLVAAMTFQAISNPPGGFIQPPFEKSWFKDWENRQTYPAGRPVLLLELNYFYILDSLALFLSVSVILWLLIKVPKTRPMMKILVGIVWCSAFCAALAFGFVLSFFGLPSKGSSNNTDDLSVWIGLILSAWFFFYLAMGLWASVRAICFLWQKADFKIKLPNWITKVRWWKKNMWFKWFKRIACFTFMFCVIAVFLLATYAVRLSFMLVCSSLMSVKLGNEYNVRAMP